ncbi:MAG: Sporulation initiation phosphotransferase F [Phycisphaerae bacterium]|nr:Sporulation initiation phosphotransferase F [Phycisphaerae bacterium]
METATASLRQRRILIIDDWPEITSLVTELFAEFDARVSVANSGWEGIVQLNFNRFDLVILDLVIPNPDGWQILKFLKRFKPQLLTRTIVLTAYRYDHRTIEALTDHPVAHLFKPFKLDELRATAAGLLNCGGPTMAA